MTEEKMDRHSSDELIDLETGGGGKTEDDDAREYACLLYTSPSPRDRTRSRMPSSA